MIYQEAVAGNCVTSYLTPLEKSNKYESLRITDELREKYSNVCKLLRQEITDDDPTSPNKDPDNHEE